MENGKWKMENGKWGGTQRRQANTGLWTGTDAAQMNKRDHEQNNAQIRHPGTKPRGIFNS
jgi:hypothetical protein